MEIVTDFEAWLNEVDAMGDIDELFCIYRTVLGGTGYAYTLEAAKGGVNCILKAPCCDDCLLLTPKSKEAFIRYLDSLYELGIEGQYAYAKAMEKDD